MQLKEIDKIRYRKHLKIIFAGIALTLIFFSLSLSTLFIYWFSTPEVSHFYHNLAGLAAAVFVVIFILNKIRYHPYLMEVEYVWTLKQQLNKIYRKLGKIKAAVEENNATAMSIMLFSYKGSKQLYELDENTITMGSLINELTVLENRIREANLNISDNPYHQAMLDQF